MIQNTFIRHYINLIKKTPSVFLVLFFIFSLGQILAAEEKDQSKEKITFRLVEESGEQTFMDGTAVAKAELIKDEVTGLESVSLDLTPKATELFGQITSKNIGKSIAIYFDTKLVLKAVIRDEIKYGKIQISGLDKKTVKTLIRLFKQSEAEGSGENSSTLNPSEKPKSAE